jgi:hypothetical protein
LLARSRTSGTRRHSPGSPGAQMAKAESLRGAWLPVLRIPLESRRVEDDERVLPMHG